MSSLIKIKSEFDLSQDKLEQILKNLSENLAKRVTSAYIFGSAARNDFSRNSDIDLILICETTEPFIVRPKAFSDLFDVYPRLDILVYTPQEFEAQLQDSSVGFWKSVRESLKKIV